MTTKITHLRFFEETPFTALIGATLTIHVLSLSVPVLTLQVYDRVIPSENANTLAVLLMGVCVALLLELLMRLVRSYILLWLGAGYEHRVANHLMSRIISSDPSHFSKESIGSMLHSLTSMGRLKEFHPANVIVTVTDVCFGAVFIAIVGWIAGDLVWISLLVIVSFVVVSIPMGALLRSAIATQGESDDERFSFLIERLNKVHVSKAFALEKSIASIYEKLAVRSSAASMNVIRTSFASINVIALFSHIMIGSIIAFGAVQVIEGEISVGVLIASVLLSGRAMQLTQRGVLQWVKYQDYAVAQEKIEQLVSMPEKPATGEADHVAHNGSLQLTNVLVGDEAAGEAVTVGAFQAEPGQSIAITGGHSRSRSVLLKTMAGIYVSSEGEVLLDGQQISRYSPKERARRVAYLGPKGSIFRGTIKENITRFGEVPLGQALEIARLLNVDQEVAKLPGGYDTFLDDNSTEIVSNGLKQRISLVRDLAVKPRVILYDNADQGLDEVGFESICNLLVKLRGKATLVLASDAPEIIKGTSKNYHFEAGVLQLGRGEQLDQFEEIRI